MSRYVLCAEITEESVRDAISFLYANLHQAVEILLCSVGGDLEAGMALYDVIMSHPQDVTITVAGCASSSAAVILQAADVRRIMPNAYVMIHRGTVQTHEASPDETEETALFSKRYADLVDKLVYNRMRKTPGAKRISLKTFQAMVVKSGYFTAEEAVKVGLVDEIVGEER